ncbi:MAG: hypothetical protein RIM33_11110 [Alphaproteobacteria bacterium]
MGGLFSAPAPPPPPPLPEPPDPEASERERRQQISERQRRGRASTIVDKRFKGVLTETSDGTAPSAGATLTGKKRLGE